MREWEMESITERRGKEIGRREKGKGIGRREWERKSAGEKGKGNWVEREGEKESRGEGGEMESGGEKKGNGIGRRESRQEERELGGERRGKGIGRRGEKPVDGEVKLERVQRERGGVSDWTQLVLCPREAAPVCNFHGCTRKHGAKQTSATLTGAFYSVLSVVDLQRL